MVCGKRSSYRICSQRKSRILLKNFKIENTISEFPDSEQTELSWQSKYEQLLQLQRDISYIPNEIEQFIQLIFNDLPSSIVYTPNSIDVDVNSSPLSNIQLQSNLSHLMDRSIEIN